MPFWPGLFYKTEFNFLFKKGSIILAGQASSSEAVLVEL